MCFLLKPVLWLGEWEAKLNSKPCGSHCLHFSTCLSSAAMPRKQRSVNSTLVSPLSIHSALGKINNTINKLLRCIKRFLHADYVLWAHQPAAQPVRLSHLTSALFGSSGWKDSLLWPPMSLSDLWIFPHLPRGIRIPSWVKKKAGCSLGIKKDEHLGGETAIWRIPVFNFCISSSPKWI